MKIQRVLPFVVLIIALLLSACTTVAPQAGAGGEQAPSTCNEVEVKQVDGKYDLGGCTLRIAVENAYRPFNYIDTDTNKAVGYDYDIFPEVCKRINCTPEFVATSWDAMVAVMGGESSFDTFDVGADGITITPERAKNVDFSIPYIDFTQFLLVNIDEDRFTQPAEFAADPNLLIGTQIGTSNYDAAASLVDPDRIKAFDQFGTAIQALLNGDVDAVMIDNVSGMGYVGVNKDKLKLTGDPVIAEKGGFIFGKGSPLTPAIDSALEGMQADGTLDRLYKKWILGETE
jgi:ABC-type amino acid transport substrate-binding protein